MDGLGWSRGAPSLRLHLRDQASPAPTLYRLPGEVRCLTSWMGGGYAFESAWYSSSGVGLRLFKVVRTTRYPAAATMTAASTGV